MATTLGFMMSGIGAATEMQRQNNGGRTTNNQNMVLNNGIAALVGQMLANPQLLGASSTGSTAHNGGSTSNIAPNTPNIDMAQLLGIVAGGNDGNVNLQGIANIIGGVMNSNTNSVGSSSSTGASTSASAATNRNTKQDSLGASQGAAINIAQVIEGLASEGVGAGAGVALTPGTSAAISEAINNAIGSSDGVRNVASIVNEFVNGDDEGGVANIAQALGIRWTGDDCLQPACLSPVDKDKRPAAKNEHCHEDTECRPGWGGWNCNRCLNDSVCDVLSPTGEGGRCYNGSELITTVVGQCYVGNTDLSRYLPEGVTPKMTFGCDRNSSSCSAQFWISGKEAFYCDLDQCNIGTWGSKSTAAIDCKRMKCKCIPGRFLCGNYGLDISTVLNEVEGPVNIKCHDDGFSNCFIRESQVSKTLTSIIGDDAINMYCTVGQCVHYSQLPDYTKPVYERSKSNIMLGVATSLLTVYVVLRLIRLLVQSSDIQGQTAKTLVHVGGNNEITTPQSSSSKHASSESETYSEISNMMASMLRATVSFRDISYTIPAQGPDLVSFKGLGVNINGNVSLGLQPDGSNTSPSEMKGMQLLKNVNGIVRPGEILAILGASGAGKSTLLDILSRREKCGKVTGKVQINDRDIIGDITTEEFHRMSGYVDQQDVHVATATVHESVMTSALLRLPRDMSLAAKEERVRDVLIDLGLWHVRDSKIGKNGARGISGGEMRRVSIACELVTSPSIIFLDEPTSGLDAYNAFVVMDTLSKLARRYSRTVICTIHQPRTDIFTMFDQLIVLAAGQMCYSGPASNISTYLESIGHPVPEGYNIADFSIDLVQQATVTSANQRGNDQDTNAATASHTDSLSSIDKKTSSDSEWSPLLGTSTLSLDATSLETSSSKKHGTNNPNHKSISKDFLATQQQPKGSQFIVYNAQINLQRLLDSFKASNQYHQVLGELDKVTGVDWVPSSFEMVTSIGTVPHIRPVTPLQQAVVIFVNIFDLVYLVYCRLKGKNTGPKFDDKLRPSLFEQYKVLSVRIFRHLYRDPTLMLANYAMSVLVGLMCGVLFYQMDTSIQGVQNRLGLLIFILAFYGFGSTTSLMVFSDERVLYLRERANAYYDPMAYFLAKVTFDLIPLRVVPPMLLTLILYPMAGLAATWHQFIKFFCTLVIFNLTIASQMFFIGLLAEELIVSNFLASLTLLFSLLFGGLILNKESIPAMLQPLFDITAETINRLWVYPGPTDDILEEAKKRVVAHYQDKKLDLDMNHGWKELK
ncbi:(ABC) transporter [Kickxella alabastrina]|uniref:(ABC) transporter n=1 Tax=Kickxella alabastrina TaxID=61397 RepID=A0ACC1ISS6_9FUNG|nr:(ABC) transporter [Kickxella alabastrina]